MQQQMTSQGQLQQQNALPNQGQMQGQTGAQNQPMMMTPPAVITNKDLMYLRDEMSWLLLATKKCAHFAQECENPQIAQAINGVGQMHQRHYNLLLKHCQHNNTAAMKTVPQPSGQAH